MGARARPIQLNVPNRLVYSPHDYGPSVSNQRWLSDPAFPDNLPGFWDTHWGYLHREGIAPILLGEFGGPSVGADPEGTWQRALVSYLKSNHMHYSYWCLNPNSVDTGGLLKDDWHTLNPDKQALLKLYQGAPLGSVASGVVNLAAVPPAAGTPSGTPTRTYVVQPGDTLTRIAAKEYGDASTWRRIAEANAGQLPNVNELRPGQTLTIP
jgi:endoglucanase